VCAGEHGKKNYLRITKIYISFAPYNNMFKRFSVAGLENIDNFLTNKLYIVQTHKLPNPDEVLIEYKKIDFWNQETDEWGWIKRKFRKLRGEK